MSNGNYVVSSPNWSGNKGAVTWGSGSSGVGGAVSATNSLVGAAANDRVGTSGITVLSNGNYVVRSTFWSGNAGAVTWGNSSSGVAGAVSAANSLVGSAANDRVGTGITALSNGNYVVSSPNWTNGSLTNAGALTLGNSSGGTSGVLTPCNSILGGVAYGSLTFAYGASTGTLFGGLPQENKVQIGTGMIAPTGPVSQSFSSGATVAGLVATGSNIQWYTAATGGAALANSTALVDGTTYYATQTVSGCESTSRLAVAVTVTNSAPQNLTVSTGTSTSPTSVPAGTYNTLTVTSTGYAQLGGSIVVNSSVTVSGGLDTNCQSLTGAGSFTLAPGATLAVCDAAGISASGGTGAVQVAGTRLFSPDASYVYNGTATQATGTGLPAQVRNLSTTNANAVTLTDPTSVAQTLSIAGAGNLMLNGQALTLLSSSVGSALVVNSGAGQVVGTATVQRYIDGSLNSGPGYRHYSAPVTNTTVADLATNGFTPVLTQSYNTSATPGTTNPFPNVFGYDQARLALVSNNYGAFDQGFVVPQSTDALAPGQGYAVNIGASELMDFQGTLGNNDLTVHLSRNIGSTAADAGWALVGNPYPAPLDWSLVQAADRTGLDDALYVVQSTGQYTGGYRAYVNGQSTTGTNNPLLATGQGFFVRVSNGNTSGTLTFRNSQRVTDYTTAQTTSFQRTTADVRPALRLTLAGQGLADSWVAYAETGATLAYDSQYDASKLPNGHGLNLSSVAGSERLAIDGRPVFTAATTLPLAVGVPAAGTYTLTAAALNNLPTGLTAYLYDAYAGTTMPLTVGQAYSFSVTATQANALVTGRFTVQFTPAAPLATVSAALAAQVSVFPNPAREQVTVVLPSLAGANAVQAELLNSLGQVVLRQQALMSASGTTLTLPTSGLANGVYAVRLTVGATVLAKRLTIQ